MASGLTREEERELEAKIKREFEVEQPRQSIMITVDWQPFETAPKDGRHIAVLIIGAGHETPELRRWVSHCFWGRMIGFPNEERWVSSTNPDNGYGAWDDEFYEERFLYNRYGRETQSSLWRGGKATHWAPLWKVDVEMPPMPKIEYGLKVHDRTKDW